MGGIVSRLTGRIIWMIIGAAVVLFGGFCG